MSEVDARIPMSYQFPQLPTGQSVEQYKQLQYRNELAQLQNQQAQQQVQDMNSLRGLLSAPGAVGENGLPTNETLTKAMSINPELGMKMQQSVGQISAQRQQMLTTAIHQRLLGLQINKEQSNELKDVATTAQTRFDSLVSQGVPRSEAIKVVSKEKNDALDSARANGTLLPDQVNVLNSEFNPEVNKAFISGYEGYQKILKGQEEDRRTKVQESREERIARSSEENAGSDPFMREAAAVYGKDTPEYIKAIKDHLTKQSGAGGTGGRESVYTGRVLMAGNQAAKDLSNVVKLPMSSSTGMFSSLGADKGPVTFQNATKAVMGNTVTSEEAQIYQTMSTGFQRTLAGIESAGLAPSGTLSHQMDAVIVKPGDTNLNKLSKLAQTRQIVESGMEVLLDNPRVSDGEKKRAREIAANVRRAVPYTQEDIANFLQSKNPKDTFGKYAGKSGVEQGPVKVSSKEDYDSLPSGTEFIAPDGSHRRKP